MTSVYILMHVTERGEHEDVKMIGAFSTEELAIAARDHVKDREGFRNHPEGFSIDPQELDRIDWSQGFIDD